MAQGCPHCGRISPPAASRCDCGYDFVAQRLPGSSIADARRSSRRRRVVGVLASLLVGIGAGHVTIGQWTRGVKWFLAAFGLVVIGLGGLILLSAGGSAGGPVALIVLIATLATAIGLTVAAAVDVARVKIPESGLPSWKGVLLGWIGFWVAGQLMAMGGVMYRTFVVQAFRMPAGSMLPALLVGDHFLVNKLAYHFTDPARGDVIVFKYPVDESRDFIKRIIAVGGEDLHIKDQKIYVNCKPPEPSCRPIDDPWGKWEERFGVSESTSVKVPAGSYFVMGDNRNNSQDSRYWGFVKREKIKGRAFFIYWSWESERDDLPLGGVSGGSGSARSSGELSDRPGQPGLARSWFRRPSATVVHPGLPSSSSSGRGARSSSARGSSATSGTRPRP
jgi:signal peptidase I